MKQIRNLTAVLCLILTLTLTSYADDGHICCPRVEPSPTPMSIVVNDPSGVDSTGATSTGEADSGEADVLSTLVDFASGVFQIFATIL